MGKLGLVLENYKTIDAKIKKSISKEIDIYLSKSVKKVILPIKKIVKKSILNQPEVSSLENGQLAAEFGLRDGKNRIENIIDIWLNGIKVSTKKSNLKSGKISAGFSISMIRRDFRDVLSSGFGSIRTKSGQELPWLEWLLRFGDIVIIRDYDVDFQLNTNSRSGKAVMIQGKGKKWRVPPQFSGTESNNFVTRALDDAENDIINAFKSELRSM